MTKEEIIQLALEAGFASKDDSSHIYSQSEFDEEICWEEYAIGDTIKRFANLVAAKERERCALVCEIESNERVNGSATQYSLRECAEAIRSLK